MSWVLSAICERLMSKQEKGRQVGGREKVEWGERERKGHTAERKIGGRWHRKQEINKGELGNCASSRHDQTTVDSIHSLVDENEGTVTAPFPPFCSAGRAGWYPMTHRHHAHP